MNSYSCKRKPRARLGNGNATILEHGRSIQHIWRAQHDPGPPPGWVQSTRHRPGDTTCIPARVQVNSRLTRATHALWSANETR